MVVLFVDGGLGVVLIGFLLFCLLDVITSDSGDIRNLPKIVWLLLIFINPIGGIAWLIAGRPLVSQGAGALPYKGNRGPSRTTPRTAGFPEYERPRRLAPDDDPEFLADLRKSSHEHEQMLGSWEDDLRKREEELRRKKERGEGDSS